MVLKMLLCHLPISYDSYKKIGIFENGDMDQIPRAYQTFSRYLQESNYRGQKEFVLCEVGPGDGLYTAVFAFLKGIRKTYLIDAKPFCDLNKRVTPQQWRKCTALGGTALSLPHAVTWRRLLKKLSARYLTNGTEAYEEIGEGEVDFLFSNAVLEHVKREEFSRLVQEQYRILKPGGRCIHQVDYKDHLGGKLNHLRFSREKWESPRYAKGGFYTNRLSWKEMAQEFEAAGFQILRREPIRFETLPIRREQLDAEFRTRTNQELMIQGAIFELQKEEAE